jgi:nucleoside-diphosphate-sugar epimerase
MRTTNQQAGGETRPLPARILVTGAGGFIGGRIADLLARENGVEKVLKISRRADRARQLIGLKLDDEASVQNALIGCGAVVHCAYNMLDMASNLRIAEVLARTCAARRLKLIHISTAAVYEPLPDGRLDECHPTQFADSYSANKTEIEEMLIEHSRVSGLNVVILQPTVVYGPGGRAWTDSPVRELLFGSVILPNEGRGLCNAVFVDDVCQAIISAIRSDIPTGEKFLISGNAPVEWRDFFLHYANMIGRCSLILAPAHPAPSERIQIVDETSFRRKLVDQTKIILLGPLSGRTRGRINMIVRRLRSILGKNSPVAPTGAKLALYSARCAIQIGKARAWLSYEPEFDLRRGMAITEGYVKRRYIKQIGYCARSTRRLDRAAESAE